MEKQPQNSQEMNEAINHLDKPLRKPHYVIVNEQSGIVNYYCNYADAVYEQPHLGGTIYNLDTTDPQTLHTAISNARKNRKS